MLALVVLMVVCACSGEMTSCGGDGAVETSSCGTAPAPSLLQTAVDWVRKRGKRKGLGPRNPPPPVPSPSVPTAASGSVSTGDLATLCRPSGDVHYRIRKEIFDMDKALWAKLKQAWQTLEREGKYKKFATDHELHYGGDMKDHVGGPPGFFAFHRAQIQDLETELIQISGECDLGFPYWDWSADPIDWWKGDPHGDRNIWSDEYMGNNDGCITSGLPANWEYTDTKRPEYKVCVERNANTAHRGMPTRAELQDVIQTETDYGDFVHRMEALHGDLHGAMQSDQPANLAGKAGKRGKASPSDPIFYLHHAFIDSLFFEWQKRNTVDLNTLLGDRKDLKGFINGYNTEDGCVPMPVHRDWPDESTDWQDDDGATCVAYEQPSDGWLASLEDAPGSSLLQALAGGGKCYSLQRQIKAGECSDEELSSLVCIDAPECNKFSEKTADEADAAFSGDSSDEAELHDFFEKEGKCLSYSSDFTEAELHVCHKCDVPCTGR